MHRHRYLTLLAIVTSLLLVGCQTTPPDPAPVNGNTVPIELPPIEYDTGDFANV